MELNLTGESVCCPSEDIVAREIAGELIIVPLASGIGDMEDELYTFNETGRAIWDRLDGVCSLHQIAVNLSEAYSAPLDEIESDVLGLMTELARRRIVVVKPV
ncbi:MAG TPA: PqqD family protein [Anaerolineaceae bacterium]|nr:PqqD family protein [Anaerolineaceae bacterium]HQH86075.1 PqqD family protein [Anaerolineaceae bacterium]